MLVKMGVDYSKLEKPIRRALTLIDDAFKAKGFGEAVLTSTYEGDHMAGSLHYANLAVDIRLRGLTREQKDDLKLAVKHELEGRYGKFQYDVLFSSNDACLHVEYDPK